MDASECIAALMQARSALDRHYRTCDQVYSGKFNELGSEARKRVGQMIWLLSEVGKILLEWEEAQQPLLKLGELLHSGEITPEEWNERMQSPDNIDVTRTATSFSEPLETLTEAFYWIAGRTRAVIRELPNLRGFEGEGVRNTRNKLLEHPGSKDSGVLITSFGWGGNQGPVVKALRFEHQAETWPDKGLFVNAIDFAQELRDKAEKAAEATAT